MGVFKMEKFLITKENNLTSVSLLEVENVLAKGIVVKYAHTWLSRGRGGPL